MSVLSSMTGLISWQNHFSVVCWQRTCCFLVLALVLATVGCGNRLGHDAEVADRNEEIAAQVKVALARESGLNAAPIDITVSEGVVTLGGFVEDALQRKKAEQAASQVTGVESIINKIQIK
ncbi:MAG: BON domain-containing protein [Nitrospirales bacterium]